MVGWLWQVNTSQISPTGCSQIPIIIMKKMEMMNAIHPPDSLLSVLLSLQLSLQELPSHHHLRKTVSPLRME